MDWQRRSLRVGTVVVLLAVMLRLYSTGALEWAWGMLTQPEAVSVLMYLETGKILRPAPAETTPPTTAPTTEPTTQPTEPAPPLPVFTGEDAELVFVRDTSGNTADVAALLESPLSWNLIEETPTVLILHTHATESYTRAPGEEYEESSEYRTLDTAHNLVSIGDRVEQLLSSAGIGVVHAETLHDYPSYDGGYDNSRATAQDALSQESGIRLVLDLHRDAAVDAYGNQFSTSATVDGRESARLMIVVGTGHPNWQENMALAVKLTALLEKMYPGITRGIITRTYDYNQDLSGGALLVEVGAAGDTREKALVAAEALAKAIIALAKGTA